LILGFSTLASSSSGNCYYIKSETTSLLVDVGISAAQIVKRLDALEVSVQEIAGVFLTHEHVDHVKSVSAFHKKAPEAWFVASQGTVNGLDPKVRMAVENQLTIVTPGCCDGSQCRDLMIGDIEVHSFCLSHDAAEPTAYTFSKDGRKIAIVTDTGIVTEEIYEALKDADLLVLEANHEENILLYGRYPYSVKRRILSDYGHLSNEAAGRCLARLLRERREEAQQCGAEFSRVPRVLLAHLSRENNTPQQAFLTVRNVLEEEDFYIGKDLKIDVLGPDPVPVLMEV
jgi:phosphoribosyl 1,2-cyclic phosphodiesterase